MIRLYLIRHVGEARQEGPRCLTRRARRRFRRAARAFAQLEEPVELVCTSPRPAARETARLFVRALRRKSLVVLEELSPRASADSLLAALAARAHGREG